MASGTVQTDAIVSVSVTPVGQSTININATKCHRTVVVTGINAVYPSTINTDVQIAALGERPMTQTFGIGKTISGADVFVFVDTNGKVFVSGLTPVPANTNMYFSLVFLAQ